MQHAGLMWYVQVLTQSMGSEYWLGVTQAISSLPIIVLSALAGSIADHFDKRRVLVMTQTAAMILAFSLGSLVALSHASVAVILGFVLINGTITACDIPTRQAFAVEMVGRRDLASGIAINSAIFNAGRMVGPMAAGITIWLVGISGCFFANGLSFIGVIAALLLIDPQHRPTTTHVKEARHLSAGARALMSDPGLSSLIGLFAFVLLTGGTYLTLLPAMAATVLRLDAGGYSLLLTANGLGGLIGAVLVARASPGRRDRTLRFGLILLSTGLISLGVVRIPVAAALTLVMTGAGFALFVASVNSTIQLSVEDSLRGRVMGVWVSIFGFCQPVGSYLAGTFASWYGTPATFLSVGILVAIATLVSTAYLFVKGRPPLWAQ